MKRRRMNLRRDDSAEVIRHPAFPVFGFEVFNELRTCLFRGFQGKLVTLKQLAFLLNTPLSTAHDWFRTAPLAQVQALLCLLERLPTEEWQLILGNHLREYHSFQHPRLAHNENNVKDLEKLLLERNGLSLITGGTDKERGFLLTALGNAFLNIDAIHRQASGLDLREPKEFVPVPGVLYFKKSLAADRRRQLVIQSWGEVINSDAGLLLVNGVLSTAPELLPSILAATTSRHVVMADNTQMLKPRLSALREDRIRIIHLSSSRKNSSSLTVTVSKGLRPHFAQY